MLVCFSRSLRPMTMISRSRSRSSSRTTTTTKLWKDDDDDDAKSNNKRYVFNKRRSVLLLLSTVTVLVPVIATTEAALAIEEEEEEEEEELKVEDIKIGREREVQEGDVVSVNYRIELAKDLSLVDSAKFFVFGVGTGEVIKGFDLAVMGMRVGGVREVVIPASLGYGYKDVGKGKIPSGSALKIRVELIQIK
jgi:FKBP-type peptidyl-prolyl cis-trans isomerase (trigger factor)